MFAKKNFKTIIILLSILMLNFLELLKYKLLNIDFSIVIFLIKNIIILTLFFINNFKLKNYKFENNVINIILLIVSFLSMLFTSFNAIGVLLLYMFLLLISFTFSFKYNYKFEISMVTSTTLLILFFVIIGVLGILKYSYLFLILLTFLCMYYIFKNKNALKEKYDNINKKSVIIFSILFLIAILGGVGRYVHKWDEYSYWAYAAKVTIDTSSIKALVSYTGSMNTYPPVSSIWHYLFSLFCGYSEPNLYIGLTLLDFIYVMPIFINLKKSKIFNIIFCIAVVVFPYLFNGSISYGLLYVDLLLGFMCSSALIVWDYLKSKNKTLLPVYFILIAITLLKPNGFVFSCCILFLFFLKDLFEKKINIKILWKKIKKYVIPVLFIILIYVSWRVISNILQDSKLSYLFKLIPESLSTNLNQKLNATFILNYFNSLVRSIDETIIYSFINIPLFAFIIITFSLIFIIDKEEKKYDVFKSLIPYTIFYITFFALTALSLFVMFTYYEASNLASFSRYLAPINIALVLFIYYKLSYVFKTNYKVNLFFLIIIMLVGFSNTTYFITDIKPRRETQHISENRNNIFSIVNDNTSKDSKVFIINQKDDDSIMPLWYARYYCYPRIVNASSSAITWKIKVKSNEWDLKDWGLTPKTFDKHIVKYDFDYVFMYTATEELYDALKDDFYNVNNPEKYKLFKVKKINNDDILLMPVK